jgi:hypothetical protein
VEYLELQLWRIYHQDPRTIDVRRVLAHITCLNVEEEYNKEKSGG